MPRQFLAKIDRGTPPKWLVDIKISTKMMSKGCLTLEKTLVRTQLTRLLPVDGRKRTRRNPLLTVTRKCERRTVWAVQRECVRSLHHMEHKFFRVPRFGARKRATTKNRRLILEVPLIWTHTRGVNAVHIQCCLPPNTHHPVRTSTICLFSTFSRDVFGEGCLRGCKGHVVWPPD